MSGIDGSVLVALEQIDPDEAAALEEELLDQEIEEAEAEEDVVFSFDF